jgi:luciferase family oxidoreductase group 1
MTTFSVLDLAPIVEGGSASDTLRNAASLARHAEKLGFARYWAAEHHNMPGIASAATAVVLAHAGAGTSAIRIGAGGIMLPNHAPLQVAEQFGTLDALFPGRVDLGLGRAPGTDQQTAMALRRTLVGGEDRFPRDVSELLAYLQPAQPGQVVQAVPGAGADIQVWILGSSLFGAQLAAYLGLPYAFASHFAPDALMHAIQIYREYFRPSERLEQPYLMAGFNVTAADTDSEAHFLASSGRLAFGRMRQGRGGRLPPPQHGVEDDPMSERMRTYSVVGGPQRVREALELFADRTGVDEVIIGGLMYDHDARLRSFEIVAEAMGLAPRAGT